MQTMYVLIEEVDADEGYEQVFRGMFTTVDKALHAMNQSKTKMDIYIVQIDEIADLSNKFEIRPCLFQITSVKTPANEIAYLPDRRATNYGTMTREQFVSQVLGLGGKITHNGPEELSGKKERAIGGHEWYFAKAIEWYIPTQEELDKEEETAKRNAPVPLGFEPEDLSKIMESKLNK